MSKGWPPETISSSRRKHRTTAPPHQPPGHRDHLLSWIDPGVQAPLPTRPRDRVKSGEVRCACVPGRAGFDSANLRAAPLARIANQFSWFDAVISVAALGTVTPPSVSPERE